MSTPTPATHHLAAILPSKGSPLEVTTRPTPTPGPGELLIGVSSIALNPIDHHQRDHGFFISSYPAIIGSDIAGTVLSHGPSMPDYAPKPGTRVLAFGVCFYVRGAPDYGALQTRVVVPVSGVCSLPEGVGFREACVLPMAVETAWVGWWQMGIPLDLKYRAGKGEGMLVWGGASSVGGVAVQSARLMGFTVYSTASPKHHEYVKRLGASRVFDYKSEDVVERVVQAAREDGLRFMRGYLAAGEMKPCLDILKELKGGEAMAKLASAPLVGEDAPKVEGVEAMFVAASADPAERERIRHFIFGVWLKEKLETGEFVPSPKVKVIEGGLESANKALDELREGVSGVKLVLEVGTGGV
ncbi:MAG: hypothetical protein M1824_004231 [Vezdaea acicularis]|nr:MAG: hypothetical protein M1824_004231 [Vezdaea acicularis]